MAENGTVRQPRAWLVLGGGPVNLMGFEAHLTRMTQSSTADAFMALDDPSNPGPAFWSAGGLIPCSIEAVNGDPNNNAASTIIEGFITNAAVDFDSRTVQADIVDKSLLLVQARSDAKFPNMTTSQIVQQLAGKAGLGTVSDPGSMAGVTFDGSEYNFLSDYENDWDAIQSLAHQDGYVAFVNGNSLYYVEPGNVTGSTVAFVYTPPTPESYETGNMMRLRCLHDFDLGSGVHAIVPSWNTFQKMPFVGESGGGNRTIYNRIPGLTMSQAQQRAQGLARNAQLHEYTIQVEAPGDVIVQPTMMVSLSGTQSSFDMTYYISAVTHRMNDEDGYTMEILGYNSAQGDPGYAPSAPGFPPPQQDQNPATSPSGSGIV